MNDTTEHTRQEDMSIERYIADKLTDAYETGMKVAEDRLIEGHTRQEDTGSAKPRELRSGEDACDRELNDRARAEIEEVQRLRHIIRHAIPAVEALAIRLDDDCARDEAECAREIALDLAVGLEPDRGPELIAKLEAS